jgi:hypothetical protein
VRLESLCMAVMLDSPRFKPVSINEAADLVGLSLSALRTYTQAGRSDLVRDLDYYVHRRGLRHRIYFTARGMQRLCSRNYSTGPADVKQFIRAYDPTRYGMPPRYDGSSRQERNQRTKQLIYLAMRAYLKHPCAVPDCRCMTHRLGLPQAAEMVELLTPAPRRRGWEKV